MAEADAGDHEQCRALTSDGERCSRPAQDDGFCYQHDESDETVDDGSAEDADDQRDHEAQDASSPASDAQQNAEPDDQTESEGDRTDDSDHEGSDTDMSQTETEPADEQSEETEQDAQEQAPEDVEAEDIDLWDARDTAERVAQELIDDPFDGIVEISKDEEADEWSVLVEVIERRSIPDTQDILGRYDVTIGGSGELKGYRLTGRYRRGDVSDEQTPEH